MDAKHKFTVRRAPKSPNLNPMEQLWNVMEMEITIIDVQPISMVMFDKYFRKLIWEAKQLIENKSQHLNLTINLNLRAMMHTVDNVMEKLHEAKNMIKKTKKLEKEQTILKFYHITRSSVFLVIFQPKKFLSTSKFFLQSIQTIL